MVALMRLFSVAACRWRPLLSLLSVKFCLESCYCCKPTHVVASLVYQYCISSWIFDFGAKISVSTDFTKVHNQQNM